MVRRNVFGEPTDCTAVCLMVAFHVTFAPCGRYLSEMERYTTKTSAALQLDLPPGGTSGLGLRDLANPSHEAKC